MQHASLQVDDWFVSIASGDELSSADLNELDEKGFVIIPGPLAPHELEKLTTAYDSRNCFRSTERSIAWIDNHSAA